MLKKLLAGATTALLALGLVTLVAGPASAHTGDLDVTATCNASTGNYDVTAKLRITNTNLNGSTVFKVGTSTFEHTPAKTDPAFPGAPIISTNNPSTIVLTSFTLPGNTTNKGPWVYAQTTFTDGYFVGSDGQLLNNLDGKCGKTITPPTASAADAVCTTPGNYGDGSYTLSSTENVTWSISSNGVNGWQPINGPNPHSHAVGSFYVKVEPNSGFKFSGNSQSIITKLTIGHPQDCTGKVTGTEPTVTASVCTATNQATAGSYLIPTITGVQYQLKGNGNNWSNLSAASYPLAQGASVVVRAIALNGNYTLVNTPASWTLTNGGTAAAKCVQPAAPTITQSVCTTPGQHSTPSYTIVATSHVTYKVGNTTVTGNNDVTTALPTSVTVNAVLDSGYVLVGQGSFQLAFTNPGDCLQDVAANVSFTDSVCTAPGVSSDATYTLPNVDGVTYAVTINNVAADSNPGTHSVLPKNASIVVDVTAKGGYHLTSPAHNTWAYTAPGACLVDASVSTVPSFVDDQCIAGQAGGATTAQYTLYQADNVSYEVSLDNQTFTPKGVGSFDLQQGQHIWIHALAASGYVLTGPGSWDYTATDLGDTCKLPATPKDPKFTPALCYPDRPGHSQASFTIVAADNVHYEYSLNKGNSWKKGTPGAKVNVDAGATVWVQAYADKGYKLTNPGLTKYTFVDPGKCWLPATPIAPAFTDIVCTAPGVAADGSYTITGADGVRYSVLVTRGFHVVHVDLDAAPGDYDLAPGDRVSITATPRSGYYFDKGQQIFWTFEAKDATSCIVDVVPTPPTVSDQICTVGPDGQGVYTNGEVTIPATTGVKYTLDGKDVTAGKYTVSPLPDTHTVAALALTGYQLDKSYTGPWTLESQVAPFCGDLPTHPIVTPQVGDPQGCAATGTLTLGNDLGISDAVIWTIDGQAAAPGAHTIAAGATVKVHAEANGPDYGFASGQQKDWTVTFTNPADCGQLKTLALTGGQLPVGLFGAAALLLVAGLSLLAVRFMRRRRGEI